MWSESETYFRKFETEKDWSVVMIKRLAACVREYKKDSILTSVTVTFEVLMEVIIPFFMAFLIDEGINVGNISNIYKYGAMLVVFALLALLCGVLAGKYAARASAGFAKNLRRDVFYRVQNFSFSNIFNNFLYIYFCFFYDFFCLF